ncbi:MULTISPECIES: hypothetical protein [unclassified Microcoleus]|uniref:hypothetical protein n=1 Tax=unclassified Microcoleus TaxID=2642155 RepID=UPI0025EA7DB3|nr:MULTISPECIES: hypothetical protein [unclassified Microcoleus]
MLYFAIQEEGLAFLTTNGFDRSDFSPFFSDLGRRTRIPHYERLFVKVKAIALLIYAIALCLTNKII